MAKQPRIEHVKFVTRKGKRYAYFNTGLKTAAGKPVRVPLPDLADPSFWPRYAALKASRGKRATVLYTVAALAQEFEASPAFTERAPNTRILYAKMLDKISAAWGKFPANDLQPADIRTVLDNEGWGAGTHNMVLAVLGAMFTWARKRGKVTAEPTRDIERRTGGSHDPWPDDIVEAALKASDPMVRLSVHLMLFTGLRINDAIALRWGDIRGDEIHVTPSKTRRFKKRLFIPMAAELKTELTQTPRVGLTVLHGIKDRQLRTRLQDFTLSLGVRTVPHGLRKNAVEALLLAGCTVAETAAITGQTYQIVEQYAAKVNTRVLGKAAIVKLDARRRNEK